MTDKGKLKISEYKYILPDEKIAQYPLANRDDSKLLVYKDGNIEEKIFKNIVDYIPDDSLIIFNNTKVIPARLFFHKDTGAKIEIFCLEPYSGSMDYQVEFHKKEKSVWKCFIGNASKWKTGKVKNAFVHEGREIGITAEVKEKIADEYVIEFSWTPAEITFGELIEYSGKIPLPPYIRRETEESDKNKYQTVYAKVDSSVAAPTAGLHFTETVFEKLKVKNCRTDYLTLNVGAGTFKPVKAEFAGGHKMHNELFCVSKSLIENILRYRNKKIIAVGTTTLRTLESLYWYGVKLLKREGGNFFIEQWYPYENENAETEESLKAVLNFMKKNNLEVIYGNTELMIVPGYRFSIADIIITNFHLPGSTLLLLIAAFIGEDWKKVYGYALNNNFRFLSYGDSSILFKKD
ncbi:MAG: S-adenosylmethionine:tRNA ribosyltransferase-isomerase [Ignavibacteriae bacterium]|nr:S-adenosylmethionine:tRNA ribosyltransferase-isomerase [Ignavibacteriota bacterium]